MPSKRSSPLPVDAAEQDQLDPRIQRAKINLETAQTSWESLQRFFANGSLIIVSDELNLIDVAEATMQDDSKAISTWMEAGLIAPPTSEQARAWFEAKADLWAVVVKPWVFAQERCDKSA